MLPLFEMFRWTIDQCRAFPLTRPRAPRPAPADPRRPGVRRDHRRAESTGPAARRRPRWPHRGHQRLAVPRHLARAEQFGPQRRLFIAVAGHSAAPEQRQSPDQCSGSEGGATFQLVRLTQCVEKKRPGTGSPSPGLGTSGVRQGGLVRQGGRTWTPVEIMRSGCGYFRAVAYICRYTRQPMRATGWQAIGATCARSRPAGIRRARPRPR